MLNLSPNDPLITTYLKDIQHLKVVGKLDMVRHSTRSFGLVLDSGDEVRDVLTGGTSELLQDHFGKEITVLG